MAGKIQNEDVKSSSEITGAGGSVSQLINDTKIYVTANSLNKQLSAAISAGDFASNPTSVLTPRIQKFTSGSGTYNLEYGFIVTSANATAGATYTNNSVTFTVTKTISAGTVLYATGNGAPLSSGTLTKASGTGDSTITFSTYAAPKYLRLIMVGGGGGGGGGGSAAGTAATDGGDTTFGTSADLAGGGTAGAWGANGGTGGGSTLVNVVGIGVAGGYGGGEGDSPNIASGVTIPGMGGSSMLGGNGANGASPGGTAAAGRPNSGGGGGGGTTTATGAVVSAGSGGGAGGGINGIIVSPSATYAYVVGAGGSGGGAGTGGKAGGAGGSGLIVVEQYYN